MAVTHKCKKLNTTCVTCKMHIYTKGCIYLYIIRSMGIYTCLPVYISVFAREVGPSGMMHCSWRVPPPVQIHICIYIYICIYTRIPSECTDINMYVPLPFTNAYISANIAPAYMCMYVCMYVCIYIYK